MTIISTLPILLYVCLLRFRVTGHDLEQRGRKLCSVYGHILVEAKFASEAHWLCLKLVDIGTSPLTSSHAALILDPEADESYNSIKAFPLADITMAYGFPVEDPSAGSAEGYIGDDHHFYGVLHLRDRTLHADPYGNDNPNFTFGGFEDDSLAAPQRPRRDHTQVEQADQPFRFHIEEEKQSQGIARARVCDLLLLADKDFFEKDANSSLNQAVRRMVHAVAQADIVFRNADFNEDGVPDNIGFAVKYILVLTSNETNGRIFGDLVNLPTVDGRQYLMRFARLRRLSEVCLGVAFSGLAFDNRTLGLSFTSIGGGIGGAAGGLCDRRVYGRSFNTLALAHATKEKDGVDGPRIPERIAALTLSHELGHSFGAHHDENFPNPECKGYLMGTQSPTDQDSRHYEFSMCSKRLIAAKLHSMSYCLTFEDRPFCGNGIVENGEACDCGMPSRCSQHDPCCTPRAGGAVFYEEGSLHKEGCTVAPTALCHPSQGLCCTAKCQFANLSRHGIDCTTLDHECTCTNSTDCRCGLGGRCLTDGSCNAAECALLGLNECSCYKKGPGGVVGRLRMCGTCCQVHPVDGEREGRCVGAEFAAREMLPTLGHLPHLWPDQNYTGPNVTLNICQNDTCYETKLRAWNEGEPCVSRNVVGLCSLTGVCKTMSILPRSNVYPEVMSVHIGSRNCIAGLSSYVALHLIMLVSIKLLL